MNLVAQTLVCDFGNPQIVTPDSVADCGATQTKVYATKFYRNSLGRGGVGAEGGCSPESVPLCDNTSLIAPILDNIADVSTGMKITFELFVRVMSRRLSM